MATPTHDAFISYRQEVDARLAAALERGLEKLAKPLLRLRAIDVFRDKTGMSASPGLWTSIEAHLRASRWLVYLASPASAASPWCAKELAWWLDHHGTEGLLLVATDGDLVWPPGAADFDWARTTALPDVVRGRWPEEPLWVDLRWARQEPSLDARDARLRAALLDLGSAIRAVPKDSLDGEDVRQHRLTRRLAGTAIGLIVATAAVAVWQAIQATRQRDQATALRDQAQSRQLAAQSAALLVKDPARALLLAAESRAVSPTVESDSALLGAITALPLARMHQHDAAVRALAMRPGSDEFVLSDLRGGVSRGTAQGASLDRVVAPEPGLALFRGVNAFAFAPDGKTWAHAGSSGDITLRTGGEIRTIESGDKVGEMNPSQMILGLAFSPDGATLASASTSGQLTLHDMAGGARRGLASAPVDLVSVAFSPDGQWLVAGGDRGFLQAFALAPGRQIPRLAADPRGAVHTLVFDASAKRLFAASLAGRVEIFDAQSGRRVGWVDSPEHGGLEAMAVSPDARFIATGHSTGAVVLWQWREDQQDWPRRVLLQHGAGIRGLAFGADGRTLVSAGADGRLFVTLPVDRGRWTRHAGARMASGSSPVLGPREATSPDGRWIALPGPAGAASAAFVVDLSGLSLTHAPRLSVLSAADRRPVADGVELPTAPGEKIVGDPVFAADSSLVALQVSDRIVFWSLRSRQALDAALPLPPSARLMGTHAAGGGWLASSASEHFSFADDPREWQKTACALAGRKLSGDEWRRHVGSDRPYRPAC